MSNEINLEKVAALEIKGVLICPHCGNKIWVKIKLCELECQASFREVKGSRRRQLRNPNTESF